MQLTAEAMIAKLQKCDPTALLWICLESGEIAPLYVNDIDFETTDADEHPAILIG